MLRPYRLKGRKTVLPPRRWRGELPLVPDQKPTEIEQLFQAHVDHVAPAGVRVGVRHLHGGLPWRADLQGPIYDAARAALKKAFAREPVITGEGGSIPVVGDFTRVLGAPVLLVGFGLPGENAHAPNEWMSVENFEKGAGPWPLWTTTTCRVRTEAVQRRGHPQVEGLEDRCKWLRSRGYVRGRRALPGFSWRRDSPHREEQQ